MTDFENRESGRSARRPGDLDGFDPRGPIGFEWIGLIIIASATLLPGLGFRLLGLDAAPEDDPLFLELVALDRGELRGTDRDDGLLDALGVLAQGGHDAVGGLAVGAAEHDQG